MMDAQEIIAQVKEAASALSQLVMDSANKFNREHIAKIMPISVEFMAAMSMATNKIVNQQGEIALLKERLARYEGLDPSNKALDICDTLAELAERNTRSKNIIMFEVPEAGPEIPISDHTTEDLKKVTDMIKHAGVLNTGKVVRVHRLGARQTDKTRPLKIIFDSSEDAKAVIYNKFKLPRYVKVKQDYTDIQRDHMKKLWNEFEKRKTNGEEDIVIKFMNGTPKIIKDKKKN